jgi:hypothetical protein
MWLYLQEPERGGPYFPTLEDHPDSISFVKARADKSESLTLQAGTSDIIHTKATIGSALSTVCNPSQRMLFMPVCPWYIEKEECTHIVQ